MKLRLIPLVSLLCVCAFAQDVADKQSVLASARQAYYSLQDEGLASFRCDITPNWDALLASERNSDPAGTDAAIKTLNQLRFSVSVLTNKTIITHNNLSGQSAKMQEALSQIYDGMQQMAEGFFDTWRLFVWNSPFSAVNGDYRLENAGATYRLTYKDGTANVATVMGKDFTISDLSVSTPEFDSALRPGFARTNKGAFLLTRYNAVYQSDKPEEATNLVVTMDYQVVEGFYLPQNLSISGSYGTSPFAIQLVFSGCQVGKK